MSCSASMTRTGSNHLSEPLVTSSVLYTGIKYRSLVIVWLRYSKSSSHPQVSLVVFLCEFCFDPFQLCFLLSSKALMVSDSVQQGPAVPTCTNIKCHHMPFTVSNSTATALQVILFGSYRTVSLVSCYMLLQVVWLTCMLGTSVKVWN